jgi:hypothetical protein
MKSNVIENEMPANNADNYLDQLHKSKGANRDTDGLGTMPVGHFIVGSVDAINGEDGKEMPDFVATKHELTQLAEYWVQERIEHDFFWFAYQATGSSEWRWSVYITRRLDRLSEILGPEGMQKAWDAAIASFRKRCRDLNDEDWRVFTEGTQEEQETWRQKEFAKDNEHK